MIRFGSSGDEMFCFTPDAASTGYPIRRVCLETQREDKHNSKDAIYDPALIEDAVEIVGSIRVELGKPKRLVDFSSHLPEVRLEVVPAGWHTFEILRINVRGHAFLQALEVAVHPGKVVGLMRCGLESAAIRSEEMTLHGHLEHVTA